MKETLIIAGFGGQGVLSMGKILAYSGVMQDFEVTWMPSYGPEMRGGTANCSVTLSDEPIGSPLITRPRALIALNQPSFDKFIDNVEEGGIVVVDTAMVPSLTEPEGVTVIGIPATKMCEEAGLKGLGNIVLIGKLWAETGFCSEEALDGASSKTVATIANVMVNLAPSFDALTPAQVRSIAGLLAEDAITFAQAREVLEAVNGTDKDPERVVDERGMRQVTDTAALEPIVDEVLARCTDQVQQYHDGNKKVVGYLVGQCMKASKGSGNPKLFNKLLTARLEG